MNFHAIMILVFLLHTIVFQIDTERCDYMSSKYLLIDKEILPDIFERVITAKRLIQTGQVKGITGAVKAVDISRSSFYKYKDYVFTFSERADGKKVTIAVLLSHEAGILSNILNKIAECKGNILTINQNIPINQVANVTLTFDINQMEMEFDELTEQIRKMDGVIKLNLLAME